MALNTADLPESIIQAREKWAMMLKNRQSEAEPVLVETRTGESPLSQRETAKITELEGIIKRDIAAFIAVGNALREIRDTRLYRVDYFTFEEYVETRWDMARRRGYQYIEAANVVENVNNCSHFEILPANEYQARILVGLPPEKQIEIWEKALKTAPEGKITAAHVRSMRNQEKGEKIEDLNVQEAAERVVRGELISSDFRAAFKLFLDEVQKEALSGWETTSRGAVKRHLKTLLDAVED